MTLICRVIQRANCLFRGKDCYNCCVSIHLRKLETRRCCIIEKARRIADARAPWNMRSAYRYGTTLRMLIYLHVA